MYSVYKSFLKIHVYMLRVTMETVVRLKAHLQLRGSAVYVSLSVFKWQRRKSDSNIVDWRLYADSRPCESPYCVHVFFVVGKPVAGDCVACVKGTLGLMVFTLGVLDSNGVWCCVAPTLYSPDFGAISLEPSYSLSHRYRLYFCNQ